MRVLIDGRPVRFPLAGVGQYVANLALGLAALESDDFHPAVLLFDGLLHRNSEATALMRHDGAIEAVRQRVLPRRLFTAWLRFANRTFPASLITGAYDIWHATFMEAHPPLGTARRLVATVHDVIFLTHPHLFPARNLAASRHGLQRQVAAADRIITVSEFTRQQLLDVTGIDPQRVTVVPNGVAIPDQPVGAQTTLRRGLGIDKPYVLYVGNIEPRKDIPSLLTAWSQTAAARDHSLVLAGAGAYLAAPIITAIGEAARHHDIRWLGYVSEAEKHALLAGAELFVYPSIYEGFGIPVVEALMHQRAVIACATSSIPEVAGPGAVLLPPSEPQALAAAIDRLLGDSQTRERLGREGAEHAAAFTWDRAAHATAATYREVLSHA